MKKKHVYIEEHDVGSSVKCDMCDEDFTNRDDRGGFLFQSKAVCPLCAPRVEVDLIKYGEERFIRGRCPEGMSFREWCLKLRSESPLGNKVKIIETRYE